MNTETWKDIKGFEGLYQISDMGRVKSLCFRKKTKISSPKILKLSNKTAYSGVTLFNKNGGKRYTYAHRLVAEAFIPNNEKKDYINHKNFNPHDNRAENLEWCDQIDNIQHSITAGRLNKQGEHHHNARLTEVDVRRIRQMYSEGITQDNIANAFGIGRPSVSGIVTYQRWKHIE